MMPAEPAPPSATRAANPWLVLASTSLAVFAVFLDTLATLGD